MSKYGVFSGQYFPGEYGEIRRTFQAVNDMRYDARQRWMEGYIFDIGYNLAW